MKILVCGGRDFENWPVACRALDEVARDVSGPITVIQGGARGADLMGRDWARVKRASLETFVAQWKRYGNAAGPIRNQKMLDESEPDIVVAFPGGAGTADMVDRAKRAGVPVKEVRQ